MVLRPFALVIQFVRFCAWFGDWGFYSLSALPVHTSPKGGQLYHSIQFPYEDLRLRQNPLHADTCSIDITIALKRSSELPVI